MSKRRDAKEVKLLGGFTHLLVKLYGEAGLPSGALYRLATPEGEKTLLLATRAFIAEIAKTVQSVEESKPTAEEPIPSWREEDGVIYFEVTSDGTTGPQWIERLKKKGKHLDYATKNILRSEVFKPTKGVTTKVAVLKAKLFRSGVRITKNIRAEADKRKFGKPNTEIACLTREMFTDEEIKAMGLYRIVFMHEPIKDFVDGLSLLGTYRNDDEQWLSRSDGDPDYRWPGYRGFAFSVSQQHAA